MLAVIKTGGKQYLVSPKQKIKIEKVDKEEGEEITFDEVLLIEEEDRVEIGEPFIKNAKVIGKVLEQGRGKKAVILKYKAKKRYRIKKGHRQPFSEVEIVSVSK